MPAKSSEQLPSRSDAIDLAVNDERLRQHLLRVYNVMGLILVLISLVAAVTARMPLLYSTMFIALLQWVVVLALLVFVLLFTFKMDSMSAAKAQTVLWVFVGVTSLSIAWISLWFLGSGMAPVFVISAAMFGTMSLYGYATKRRLSGFGFFLLMALIGLMIAFVANIMLGSSALLLLLSAIGVLLFAGLTAYYSQRIRKLYA